MEGENLSPLEDQPDPRIDDFEIHRMKWAANAGIIEHAYALVEQDDLDPTLADDVEAAIREDDHNRFLVALTRLLEAVTEAKGLA